MRAGETWIWLGLEGECCAKQGTTFATVIAGAAEHTQSPVMLSHALSLSCPPAPSF